MNVSCSSCDTVYRIDPDKVPEAGVRVRCTVCSNVISVSRNEEIAVIAAPVDGGVQPAVERENRPPALSQEQMAAAALGDAFISPTEQQADTTPPPAPVPEPTPAPPEPLAVPSPLSAPTPTPVAEAPPVPSQAPESPAARPVEPVPPAVPPAPVSEVPEPEPPPPVHLEPAAPSPVATAPRPPAAQPAVQKGGLRVARPFSPPAPGQRPTGAPQEPQRPIAPVFRPTPGMPLKPAAPLPAEPKPPAVPAQPVAEVPPTPITPQEPAPAVPPATPVAQAPAAAPRLELRLILQEAGVADFLRGCCGSADEQPVRQDATTQQASHERTHSQRTVS